jgi:hypothetical protein
LKNPKNGALKFRKGHFTMESIKEFKYLLLKESWQKVLLNSEVKTKFKGFMDMVYFYFDIAIPFKIIVCERNQYKD